MNRASTDDEYRYDDMLRAWAAGYDTTEAATELLLRGFGGRFAQEGNPWIHTTGAISAPYIVWDDITPDSTATLSGGEYRYLQIAASIGGGQLVDLRDAVHLDPTRIDLVLAAIAHAAGTGDLHPWPTTEHQ